MKTWLFWDWWHIEHQDNVALRQGQPEPVQEATYEDPTLDYLGMWPRVWRDDESGRWRMIYAGSGFPMCVMGAESDDGVHWRPMDCPDVEPGGEKLAPHHLFTVQGANGGPMYIDPAATDGNRFKLYCIQRGGPAAELARLNPNSYFHEMVTGQGAKPYLAENRVAVSGDGVHWRLHPEATWTLPHWHPDPPLCCFYDPVAQQHIMITRPGWGDRRIARITSEDGLRWGDLQLVMQPDLMDEPQTQFYGMPVHRYKGLFVGFLWVAHFASSARLARFNQLWGYIDCQLTWSWDGTHFQRGIREPFIGNGPLGEPGSGVVYPVDLIEHEDELRIYSVGTLDLHHQYSRTQFEPKGKVPPSFITMHRLRRDGFMYLTSRGHWATFTTKPLLLQEPELFLNALGPHGEIQYQLTDLESRPLAGFTFDDCAPRSECDGLRLPLEWRERSLTEVLSRPVRLEIRFRHARLYAIRGDFHFADALDVARADDGQPVNTELFDF